MPGHRSPPAAPRRTPITAYAVASLRSVDLDEEVAEYLRRIDATLPRFGGTFLVHGATPEVVDGDLPGSVVVIGFPDVDSAHAWYRSAEYQAILPLRLRNSVGGAVIVAGVPEGYWAASLVDGAGARP
jgi:uncharacterized protein (DUF1330 family)